ncbi:unnamed protein product, partial [Rotaria socialis]
MGERLAQQRYRRAIGSITSFSIDLYNVWKLHDDYSECIPSFFQTGVWKDAIQAKLKHKRFEHRDNDDVK